MQYLNLVSNNRTFVSASDERENLHQEKKG
jgi:hypothetical protein